MTSYVNEKLNMKRFYGILFYFGGEWDMKRLSNVIVETVASPFSYGSGWQETYISATALSASLLVSNHLPFVLFFVRAKDLQSFVWWCTPPCPLTNPICQTFKYLVKEVRFKQRLHYFFGQGKRVAMLHCTHTILPRALRLQGKWTIYWLPKFWMTLSWLWRCLEQ